MHTVSTSLFVKFTGASQVELIAHYGPLGRSCGVQLWTRAQSLQLLEWHDVQWRVPMADGQVRCLELRGADALLRALHALQALAHHPFLEQGVPEDAGAVHVQLLGSAMLLRHAHAAFSVPVEWVAPDWAAEVLQEPRHAPPACIITLPPRCLRPLQLLAHSPPSSVPLEATCRDLDALRISASRADATWTVAFALQSSRPPTVQLALTLDGVRSVRAIKPACHDAAITLSTRALYHVFLRPLAEAEPAAAPGAVNLNLVPGEMLICWMQWSHFGLGPILSFAFIPSRLDD